MNVLLAGTEDVSYFRQSCIDVKAKKTRSLDVLTQIQSDAYFSNVSGEKETMSYFAAHFEEQLKIYKKQVSHISPCAYFRMC